jgi:GTP cyclohydrolase II/3,4-dihydroxy 2-butanone 4-phosphate synthase/GTP cyclohydrolase II
MTKMIPGQPQPALQGLPAPIEGPFYARANLPTEHGEFCVRVFVDDAGREHVVLSVGELEGAEALPVRMHSECMTSEVFGSLKCDCKHQLDAALRFIQHEGRGVVIYLRQEGRGIGLGNKIRAYALQTAGADTVDANRMLGLEDDTREYSAAVQTLRALDVRSVRLLTNNPLKLKALVDADIKVERVELVTGINPTNVGYLETKRLRMGHLYGALEADAG